MTNRQIAKFVITINVDDAINKFTPDVAMVETELAEFKDKEEHDFADAYHKLFLAMAARMRKGVILPMLDNYVKSLNGGLACKYSCPDCHLEEEVVHLVDNNPRICNFGEMTKGSDSGRGEIISLLKEIFTQLDAELGTSNKSSEDGAEPDEEVPDAFKDFIEGLSDTDE